MEVLLILIIAICILFLLTVTYMYIETFVLTSSVVFFSKNSVPMVKVLRNKYRKADIPDSFNSDKSLRILQFSDVHINRMNVSRKRINRMIKAQQPDFIIFTGDFFEYKNHITLFLSFIEDIRSVYSGKIYMCLGNHDRLDVFAHEAGLLERFTGELDKLNITLLENKSEIFKKDAKVCNIIGLSDDRWYRVLTSSAADINDKIRQRRSGSTFDVKNYSSPVPPDVIINSIKRKDLTNILITHNSDVLIRLEDSSVDFALSGHTHGAQIRTPFNIGTHLLHKKDLLAQKGMIRGLHKYNNIYFYINRGLGATALPIRFLSPPEITLIIADTSDSNS